MEGVTVGSGAELRHNIAEDEETTFTIMLLLATHMNLMILRVRLGLSKSSDGWFIGMVPNLVTGVWVGGEDKDPFTLRSAYGSQGATMSLPI